MVYKAMALLSVFLLLTACGLKGDLKRPSEIEQQKTSREDTGI